MLLGFELSTGWSALACPWRRDCSHKLLEYTGELRLVQPKHVEVVSAFRGQEELGGARNAEQSEAMGVRDGAIPGAVGDQHRAVNVADRIVVTKEVEREDRDPGCDSKRGQEGTFQDHPGHGFAGGQVERGSTSEGSAVEHDPGGRNSEMLSPELLTYGARCLQPS